MIDWQKTFDKFGIKETDRISKKQKIILKCDFCDNIKEATKFYHYRFVHKYGFYRCKKCSNKQSHNNRSEAAKKLFIRPDYIKKQKAKRHTQEVIEQSRTRSLLLWKNAEYLKKFNAGFDASKAKENLLKASLASANITSKILREKWKNKEYQIKMSVQSKRLWESDEYRNKKIADLVKYWSKPENRRLAEERSSKLWDRPDMKAQMSQIIKEKWSDHEYAEKCAIARSNRNKSSCLENIIADILTAYNIKFKRQVPIGPWVYDFLLIESNLLIEVNGFYHHQHRSCLDKAKSTYALRHTPYKLQTILESDFLAINKLKNMLGKLIPLECVDFNDLVFEQCLRNDIINLFSAFHYLGKPTRGGRYFRIVHKGITIAGLIASHVHREQVATSIGLASKDVIEISRLVIHPKYQIKNLASWMISAFRKWIKSNTSIVSIIAFSDSGFHNGTIYKAAGFIDFGFSRTSDYEYRDKDGFRLHKKTVWDAAKKNNITEIGYAAANNLSKIKQAPKRKFVCVLK